MNIPKYCPRCAYIMTKYKRMGYVYWYCTKCGCTVENSSAD